MKKTKWGTYVLAISDNQSEISKAAGVAQSTVSRWMSGEAPKPESVINLARHYHLSPVAALVAAGFLKPSEITDSGVQPRKLALHEFTELELAQEIVRRAAGGSSAFDVVGDEDTAGTDELGVLTAAELKKRDLSLAALRDQKGTTNGNDARPRP